MQSAARRSSGGARGPIAEALLKTVEAAKADPGVRGDTRFVLARTLPAREIAHARELAKQARAELVAAGAAKTPSVELVDTWLPDPNAKLVPLRLRDARLENTGNPRSAPRQIRAPCHSVM